MRAAKTLGIALGVVASVSLTGCGTSVPSLSDIVDSRTAQVMVDAIVSHVNCEIQTAVQFLLLDDIDAARAAEGFGLKPGRSVAWLEGWAAQVTLTITIDERTGLAPDLVYTPSQVFSLGLAGAASAEATRKDTLSWLVDFRKLASPASLSGARVLKDQLDQAARATGSAPANPCTRNGGVLIESDLKLKDWLYAAVTPAFVRDGAVPDYVLSLVNQATASKKDVISHQVTCIVSYGGEITPAWKLTRVLINQGPGPLLGAERTRTQDLTITMGPAPKGIPSTAVQNATLASQIGLSVTSALRALRN
jgi:hypothetical protein